MAEGDEEKAVNDEGGTAEASSVPSNTAKKIGSSSLNAARAARRGKVSAERKLAYVRLQGTGRGALDVRVKTKNVTIGRRGGGADCQLKVDSRTVSRLHAKLEWSESEKLWMIHCLSKKNGVLVDGVPISYGMPPLTLKSCQLIELGDAALYFLEPKPPLKYSHDIEKTEADIIRKRKAKEEAEQRKNKQAKKKEAAKGRTEANAARKSRSSAGSSAAAVASAARIAAAAAARENWTKKEKGEFLRAIFAIGVRKTAGGEFDWEEFRHHSGGLSNKEDKALKLYYERLMRDVDLVVDTANKSKKATGTARRTQHKDSCECVICEHSRRKAARIAAGKPRAEDLQPPAAENAPSDRADDINGDQGKDETDEKTKEQIKNALVSLVTAQKLRVRLGLIEAANDVESPAGIAALDRLSQQTLKPAPSGDTLPSWWISGKHDREMMLGVIRHGVGKWEALWDDPSLPGFAEIKSRKEEAPNARAAMRRLREVASAILAEKRRRAKRVKAPQSTARKPSAPRKSAFGRASRSQGSKLASSSEGESNSDDQNNDDDLSDEASEEASDDASDDASDASDDQDDDKKDNKRDRSEDEDNVVAAKPPLPTVTRRRSPGRMIPPKPLPPNSSDDDDEEEEVEVEIVEEVEEDDDDDESSND
eukprot:Plantae.Rhodophyta-Purpureofilum_apyrenoidigerum.ctg15091.p1 GENE.Plantae.Rhodophyta-Purpureofilum_apyrenoidigerum.ctg15091~~Plantae.Rhodophyta-Purpureofilum_apyrenoidigerum.ctg15091.p1  ORF type:complete len:651 (+),score=155.57 Plantae.Rhodophyta-Purpureofilum_apyrenoidigerum.ctg15091:95-2047(+)